MERVKALIDKLHEQSHQGANAAALLETVQQLQAELAHVAIPDKKRQFGTAKVAVVLPSNNRHANTLAEESTVNTYNGQVIQDKIEETGSEIPVVDPPAKKETNIGWLLDPVKEIPTLAHQTEVKELNDVIGQNGTSLNERLKTPSTELGETLIETPIKDLKKAIGVNDRYVFVSELFRGDEPMYERSIKTINNFRILPEAQYWMERELKIKLAWDDKKEVTQHFYHLVKRRFS
jgi:hypothetical protein